MKKSVTSILFAIASFLITASLCAQNDTYSFLYKDGLPVFLNRTNNQGVTVGAFGFGGILLKDGRYTLFPLPGDNIQTPQVSDINDGGHIVGEYFTQAGAVGYLLKNGAITVLQVPGAGRTTPQGLNNGDVVVGTVQVAPNKSEAFIYRRGEFTRLAVPGAIFVNLWDINDAGDAVGEVTTSTSPTFDTYPFLYRNGVITPLPVIPGAGNTRVFSINNRGEMTGMLLTTNQPIQQTGFILRNGQFEMFRILGSVSFVPFGINDKGDITGTYFGGSLNFEGTTFIRPGK